MTDSREESYAGVFDGRIGFGNRPALVLVDFLRAYTTVGSPLYAPDVITAVANTAAVLGCIRASAGYAVQHGLRTIVTRDRVADRHRAVFARSRATPCSKVPLAA